MTGESVGTAAFWGNRLGLATGYFLFTTILYLILLLLDKLPGDWTYLHITGITLIIALLGTGLQRALK